MNKAISEIAGSFHTAPWGERLLLLLIAALFLPFYISGAVTLITVCYICASRERRRTVLQAPFFPALAAFGALLLIVPLFYRNFAGFGCGLLLVWYFIIALYARTILTRALAERMSDAACVMSLVNLLAALIEKLAVPDVRVTGFFYNANFYAYAIELVAVLTMYRMITAPRRAPFYSAVFVLNIIALLLTDCRSAWIALLAGLLTLFALQKKGGRLAILGVAAAVCTVLIRFFPSIVPRVTTLKQASSDRMYVWIPAFHDFLAHPIFGRGMLAMYQVTNNPVTPHAHNMALDALECFGIAGTALLAVFFIGTVIHFVRRFKFSAAPERAVLSVAAGCFAVTLVHGVTDVPYVGVQTGLFFFLLLAFAGVRTVPEAAAHAPQKR